MEALPLLILIALALVVFVVLPRRQRQNMAVKQQQLRESMTPGTRVMTTSGLYGSVVRVTDQTVDLEIAPGLVTTWLLAAVREVVPATTAEVTGGAGTAGATAAGGVTGVTGPTVGPVDGGPVEGPAAGGPGYGSSGYGSAGHDGPGHDGPGHDGSVHGEGDTPGPIR